MTVSTPLPTAIMNLLPLPPGLVSASLLMVASGLKAAIEINERVQMLVAERAKRLYLRRSRNFP